MNWISIVFFVIAFVICCTMLKRGADIISPARVFGFTWCIVFGLANLKFSRLQFEWTFSQWVYIMMGPISFLLGLFILYVLSIGTRLQPINEVRQIVKHQKINETKLFYLIIFAFIIYLGGYIAVNVVGGPIPIFSANPSAARTEFSAFGVGLFIHTMPVIVFFSIVYHLLVGGNELRKRILKVIVFISVSTYLFLLQRYALIMISVVSFAIIYYVTRYIRFKTVMTFVAVGVLIFYSIATLRAGKIIQTALYVTSEMKFSSRYAVFTEPYMYVVMNVENFAHALSKLEHHTFGYYTFNFVLALTGLKHWIEGYYGIVDTPYLFSGYNTYTLFWTLYRDFGLFGISMIPLFLGLFVGTIYYALRRNPTIELVSFYSIIVFVMALSFFVNLLGFLWFVYIIIWVVLILKLIRVNIIHKVKDGDIVVLRRPT